MNMDWNETSFFHDFSTLLQMNHQEYININLPETIGILTDVRYTC